MRPYVRHVFCEVIVKLSKRKMAFSKKLINQNIFTPPIMHQNPYCAVFVGGPRLRTSYGRSKTLIKEGNIWTPPLLFSLSLTLSRSVPSPTRLVFLQTFSLPPLPLSLSFSRTPPAQIQHLQTDVVGGHNAMPMNVKMLGGCSFDDEDLCDHDDTYAFLFV